MNVCKIDRIFTMKIATALAFVFVMTIVSLASIFSLSTAQAQATLTGSPLYSWGGEQGGRLGRPVTEEYPRNLPARVGTADNWIHSVSASGGSHAINVYGHLYTWGASGAQRGRGLGNTQSSVPVRVETPPNTWIYVSARNNASAAIDSDGHLYTWGDNAQGQLGRATTGAGSVAGNVPGRVVMQPVRTWTAVACGATWLLAISSDGHLYSWGDNRDDQLGRTPNAANPANRPGRVGSANNWVGVATAGEASMAVTSDGYLYTWGDNSEGHLGRGIDGGTLSQSSDLVRVQGISNVVSIAGMSMPGAMVALTSDGYIYTWGNNTFGQLGLGSSAGERYTSPQRVGDANNWTMVMGGNAHVIALNDRGEIFAWGRNHEGQLGLGDYDYRNAPYLVGHATGVVGAANGGGSFSLALLGGFIPRPAPEVLLTKTLRLPENVAIPDVTFAFEFERVQIELDAAHSPLISSRPVAQVPEITPNPIITLDLTTVTTSGGVTTVTGTLDIWEIIEGLDFPGGGVYVWEVREVVGSSGTTPPSNMNYSDARFQVRAYVNSAGELRVLVIYRMEQGTGSEWQIVGDKLDGLSFTNTYTRIVGNEEYNALEITKTISDTSLFANLSTLFDFTLSLSASPLHPVPTPLTANVVDSAGTVLRTVTITGGQATFQLAHNERLAIAELPAGTSFTVTEAAHAEFSPEVSVVIGGNVVHSASGNLNTDLSSGTHLIAVTDRNAADFTNVHQFVPPAGLDTADIDTPRALVVFSVVALPAMLLAKRKLRLIEDLSITPLR